MTISPPQKNSGEKCLKLRYFHSIVSLYLFGPIGRMAIPGDLYDDIVWRSPVIVNLGQINSSKSVSMAPVNRHLLSNLIYLAPCIIELYI